MPIRDAQCKACGKVEENYYGTFDKPPIPCEVCGGETVFLPPSRFAIVFTGSFSAAKYNDPKLDGAHQEGFWATAKNTVDGKPKQVYIDNWQKRKEFMKSEGLTDSGPREASPDGKSNGREGVGLPGQWV